MFDESKYPTLRYMRCKKCGNIFVMGFSGVSECPDCSSTDAAVFEPNENSESQESTDVSPEA